MFRRIPPAYSPLPPSSLLRGLAGLLSPRLAGQDRAWLEHAVQTHFAAPQVLLTDSGTSALMLALMVASERAHGAPVALPAFACYDLATAAEGARTPVLLYDVDPLTLAPEPASLKAVLAAEPAALVAVHLYGIPVDVARLRDACRSADVLLIEDVAQAFGSGLGDRPVGGFGSLAVLSFGRGKGLTGGRGGALVGTKDLVGEAQAMIGRFAPPRRAPWTLAALGVQWLLGRPELYGLPTRVPLLQLGETIHRTPQEPQLIGATAPSVLQTTWHASMEEIAFRRRRAQRLWAIVERHPDCRNIKPPAESRPAFLRYPFLIEGTVRAGALKRAADLGIMPSYPKALLDLDGFAQSVRNPTCSFDGARYLASNLWTAPAHSLVTDRDMKRIETWFATPFKG